MGTPRIRPLPISGRADASPSKTRPACGSCSGNRTCWMTSFRRSWRAATPEPPPSLVIQIGLGALGSGAAGRHAGGATRSPGESFRALVFRNCSSTPDTWSECSGNRCARLVELRARAAPVRGTPFAPHGATRDSSATFNPAGAPSAVRWHTERPPRSS